MVQESGGPGEKQFFPAVKGESETAGRDRGFEKAPEEMMKCGYCEQFDHLDTSCPTKLTDRRKELGLGYFFLFLLGIFWIIGIIGGFIWSALKTGFEFGDGMWPETWKAVRGKKNDDGEQISD